MTVALVGTTLDLTVCLPRTRRRIGNDVDGKEMTPHSTISMDDLLAPAQGATHGPANIGSTDSTGSAARGTSPTVGTSVQETRRCVPRAHRQWPAWTTDPPAASMTTAQLCLAWCRTSTVRSWRSSGEGWAAAAALEAVRARYLDEIERRHLAATTLFCTPPALGWPVDNDTSDPPSPDER